ncbi:cell cycle checkpoint protein RAD1 [Aquila chrysaetos chrysaetos]|uniref:cell cycle checkpoint protein RAD1 n=1 Tax=Aquila chrysaetos chrysaetos TaxID=223781 RepID=UPI001176CF56|nr:cell cycle checkpoint protein RAD1 [Aquila chrysaetos chrysaetos]
MNTTSKLVREEDPGKYRPVSLLSETGKILEQVLPEAMLKHMEDREKTPLSSSLSFLLQAEIFQEFAVQEESVTFRINLSVLLDCLTIFGTSALPGTPTALRMCYRGYSYPLMLFLEEGGVVTVCKINTQEPDELLDFDFCSTNVVNKVILQSEGLREAFAELDMTSEVLQITMSPDKPYFRLSTFGNAGSAHLDYPRDSDLMEAFHCNQTQTNRYKISLLKPSTKALALSCKVSIRTDAQGFLSLQYMIRNEDGQICFVEYYCCPDEDITEAEL